MSDHIHDSTQEDPSQSSSLNYPWAAAPDIIRSNQKDAYFQAELLKRLSAVIRSLYGTRAEHQWANEASVFTELLYLGLTTFLGNRTLGEEYCDIVQVADATHALPSLARRSGYILASVLLPYALSRRLLPALRRRLRAKLERQLTRAHRRRVSSPSRMKQPPTRTAQFQDYVLRHLDTLTSPAPLYALGLAVFYFTGAYYQLSKRVFGLRYIFTRKLTESDQRAGYEVLGVLLVVQMAVQTYLHLQDTYRNVQVATASTAEGGDSGGVDAGPPQNPFNTSLLFDARAQQHGTADPDVIRRRVAQVTHTPLPPARAPHRHDLRDERQMRWMESAQQRKCTLCLEPLKDPCATTCGHVFCWACVTDWLREQAMCPLCRQSALVQHLLPLRS